MSDNRVFRRDLLKTVGVGATVSLAGQTVARTSGSSCESVEHNLNTGYDQDADEAQEPGTIDGDWQITLDEKNGPASVPRPADVVDDFGWPAPFADSQWISIEPTKGWLLPPSPSQYEYTYCFCLKPGFENPELDLTIQAGDVVADLKLNGQSLPISGDGDFRDDPLEETYTDPDLFEPGENCLRIVIQDNHEVITGMNLVGSMTADNADCDCCDGPCDLSVTKTPEGDFRPGEYSHYVIDVCNKCIDHCEEPIEVIDELPDGFEAVDAWGTGWNVEIQGDTVFAEHPNDGGLEPAECLPSLIIEVEIPSVVENCVDVRVGGEPRATDCVEHETHGCDEACAFSITKSVEEPFEFGEPGTYVIEVCNVGGSECTDPVRIEDALPDGIEAVDATGTGWTTDVQGDTVFADHPNDDGLAPGECLPILVIEGVVVDEADWPHDEAVAENCVRLRLPDRSTVVTDCVEHDVGGGSGGSCEMTVEKSTDGQFYYGEAGTYVIEVCNVGDGECTGPLALEDDLPDGMEVIGYSAPGWDVYATSGSISAEHPNDDGMAPGDCLEIEIDVEVASIHDWPGGSDAAENCAELYYDGQFQEQGCVEHVIFSR